MSIQQKITQAARAYVEEKLDAEAPEVERLIGQAKFDLHFGSVGEEDYPGFETACRQIRDWFDDLDEVYYLVWCDEIAPLTPADLDEAGGGEVYEVNLKRAYLGELAGYC